MRALLATLLLLPCAALAADGDLCGVDYSTFTNAAACIIACDDAAAPAGEILYQCNGGAGLAPPAGYRGGTVRVEIASAEHAACRVEVFEGASAARRHYLGTLHCGQVAARLTIPAGQHVAGRLYFDTYGGALDVVTHWELGED